ALAKDKNGEPLPGVAPVAMQQGKYVAWLIKKRLLGKDRLKPFKYHDRGSLAVIGRNAAVAWFGWFHLTGFTAWLVWVFVHIAHLIEYDNKLIVLIQWAWNFFTRKKGARLITRNL
ncbi:MAG: NAD(P)/FAD-dependent oxidoreductase, partial [candidate division Zixibacteria bacterium]|nr:NAD(P)/FAD-dependent oxidoreductase [candidate division Zixibacteria bacterium]